MIDINNIILPVIVLFIIFYGHLKHVDIYNSFLSGCMDGFNVIVDITPTIITIIFAIEILLKSNFLTYVFSGLNKFTPELISMMILRPISGNATLGILSDIYRKYGVDSYNGFLASLIQGSTETAIYVVALYYGSVGVKKIKNTLKIGLIVDFIGILLGILFASFFFF